MRTLEKRRKTQKIQQYALNLHPIEAKNGFPFFMIFLSRMCQFFVDRATFLRYTYFCICDVRGSIAQLGEHLPYKQGVTGSSPVVPTNFQVAR